MPDERYPVWAQRSIRSQAVLDHLYTSTATDVAPDAFERFLKDEIEEPALEALERVVRDDSLTIEEHNRITRYAVALDQRTPAAYFEHLKQWQNDGPTLMKETLVEVKGGLERDVARGRPIRPRRRRRLSSVFEDEMINQFPMTVKIERLPDGGGKVTRD